MVGARGRQKQWVLKERKGGWAQGCRGRPEMQVLETRRLRGDDWGSCLAPSPTISAGSSTDVSSRCSRKSRQDIVSLSDDIGNSLGMSLHILTRTWAKPSRDRPPRLSPQVLCLLGKVMAQCCKDVLHEAGHLLLPSAVVCCPVGPGPRRSAALAQRWAGWSL